MANEFKVKKGLIVDGSNTVLDVQGTSGQLFSVTDSLTGDLFSVSDVSGIPIFNVNSSGLSTFDGDVLINQSSNLTSKALQVNGFIDITDVTGTALRWYNGSTFRGGLGLNDWAMSGSAADTTMYIAGDNSFFVATNNVSRLEINSSGANFTGDINTSGDVHIDEGDTSDFQTTSKLRFGHSSWNNNVGLESYWMVLGCNQNEGFKFRDSSSNMLLQLNGGNNTGGNGALSATFAGAGTFETTLNVSATDGGSSPAMTAIINMHGYDGRGVGIKMKDNVTTSGGGDDNEWFVGTGYNQSGFNIGYAADGSQSSYSAQAKLQIATNGNATFAGTIASGAITVTGGSNQTIIDSHTAFDLTDGSKDTLLITNNATTSAIGAIGPSIGFGNMNSDRRTSAIGAIRTGGDHDQMGLAFFTHSGTGNDDTVVKQLELAHDGTATFAGSIITNLSSEGTYFTGGSGSIRQLSITSGTNTSAHALHTFNIASSNGKYEFDVNGVTKLSLTSAGLTVDGEVNLDVMPDHESEGIIRIGRYDANATRYHDIKSYVSSTTASNYLKFSLHGGTENAVADVLTLKGDLSSTFAGNVRLPNGGKLYTWTDHDLNYLKYDIWRASASAGMTIENISSEGEIYLKSGNALALTLDDSQNATFAGYITTSGSKISVTQADGDDLAKLYQTSADGFLELFTGQATPVSRVKLSSYGDSYIAAASTGRVGIGTTSPNTLLHINKEDAASTVTISRGGSNISASTEVGKINFQSDYNSSLINFGYIQNISNNLGGLRSSINLAVKATSGTIENGLTVYGTNDGPKVGIGTTSPNAKLQLGADQNSNATGISLCAGASVGNLIARTTTHHNWFPYTDGNNYYSAGTHNFRDGNNGSNYLTLTSSLATFANDVTVGDDLNISGEELTFTNDAASAYIRAADALLIQSDYNTGEDKPIYLQPSATTKLKVATAESTFYHDVVVDSSSASGSTILDVQGTAGQLFSVTNSLTGDLFSVSDISGVPIFNVNSSGLVEIDGTFKVEETSTFKGDVEIHNEGNDTTGKLTIAGNNNTGTPGVKTSGTIEHRGEHLKTVITHNGSDVITIGTGTDTAFAGMVTTSSRFNASTQALHFPNYTGSQGWQIGSDSTAVGMYIYSENGTYGMKLTKTGDVAFAGSVTSGGNLYLAQYMYHNGDVNTNINFESSQITIATSGGSHIQINNDENIYFRTNGTNRFKMDTGGTFTATADIIAFGSVSDKSYKENIKPITGALELVDKLKGVTFDWKENTDTNKMVGIKEDIGFIAQDVQEVLPTLVRENDNGKLSLRDKGIVPVLVEAIKELKQEIEQLKKQINNG